MAIARKPKSPEKAGGIVDIRALINKGGSVPSEKERGKPGAILLRIPSEALIRIDEAVKTRSVRIPRHTWILEAIMEKLEKGSK